MSSDCSMSDMEGSSSDSDVLNCNKAAKNGIDNAAPQVPDNASQNVLDNEAHQVPDNAAIDGAPNAAENVISKNSSLKVPANSGDEISPKASPKSRLKSSGNSNERVKTEVTGEESVIETTLFNVVQKMFVTHYDISRDQEYSIYAKCKQLFEQDYLCKVVVNDNFALNYPIGIIVPVCRKDENENLSMEFDVKLYTELIKEAPEARLRSRFATPAILFDHKFICRSGTLTSVESASCEHGRRVISTAPVSADGDSVFKKLSDAVSNFQATVGKTIANYMDPEVMKRLLVSDVKVLKYLKVERVCDLMVEYAKHYRSILEVSSTEKANEDMYGEVKLGELPFPGCEFFTYYSKADKNAQDLRFDWNESDVKRRLMMTEDVRFFFPEMNVEEFRKWDLIELTQNYLKIILCYLATGAGGMVVHCISGWDRTPLFISLLRLSLWADGVVHQSLQSDDIAYLTVAYDWFLFGHNLPERFAKKEEIMHFCFNFLEHITSDEFSITRLFKELPPEKKANRNFPEFAPGKRLALNGIRACVLEFYDEAVRGNEAKKIKIEE